jgi:hypothetical protein
MKNPTNLQSTTLTNPISLHRYSTNIWLESQNNNDWLPYPVVDDAFGRLIYKDPTIDGLRVTDASLVGVGGTPTSYWNLDVPPPTQGFAATLSGTADDDTEIPETRYYVCTFVNSYGAEGPPSPPSNEVEWRTGQIVTLSNLPSVPSGSYNITHRRIYRLNTGSTGVTNYQFVTEIAVAQSVSNISAISQENPIVVDTVAAHGLTDGQQVKFEGLGTDTAQPVTQVLKQNPIRITVVGHGFTSGMTVGLEDFPSLLGDELNGVRGTVILVDADRFEIDGIDATGYHQYAGGGTAARVYGMDELDDQQYFISVIDTDSFSLDGVDGTGYKAYADSGTVAQVAGTSYIDNVPSANLAEVLPTELYDPPNPATKGLKLHPAGFLVGFYGKTLCFSEFGAPHAWPIDYRLSTNHDIVGLGIFGNTVVVTTKGWPEMAIGSDPAAMSKIELELEQACVSRRGIVDFGTVVAYPSPDGLMVVSNSGAENISAFMFTRDQWQALNPSSFLAFNWENQYLCFYYDFEGVQRAFIIDPLSPDSGVRYVNKYATGGYKDIEEDLLYLIIDDEIEKWDQGTKLQYTWKSKPMYTPHAVNMAACKVIADNYPVELEFFVDDVRRHTRVVGSLEAFRLPSGFRGEKFEIVAKGKEIVSEIIMATTMTELSITI